MIDREEDMEEEEDGTEAIAPMNGTSKLLLPARRNSKTKEPYKVKSLSSSQASTSNKNPFKVSSSSSVKLATPNQMKRTSVFDSMEKTKPGRVGNSLTLKPNKDSQLLSNKQMTATPKKGPSQIKLFGLTKTKSQPKGNKEVENNTKLPKTGFQMWFEANHDSLLSESPQLKEDELTIKAAKAFKQLSKGEQKEWQTKAETKNEKETDQKRKQLDTEAENEAKENGQGPEMAAEDATEPQTKKLKEVEGNGKKPKGGTNKLLGFAFSKS